ncbi:MAG: molybdopterin-dependent oxidoreductase, partial [Deltaproteobacteria bacterium]|nr:molybdopterin-dependent oxidoreductase [Deltaproteobacteria bacterium]
DLSPSGNQLTYFAWDQRRKGLVVYDPDHGFERNDVLPALSGQFTIRLSNGIEATCRPVLDVLKNRAAPFAPEQSETITGVPAGEVRRAARLFATEKPSCYCTWVGLEQDAQAMQTNRAVCIFYALSGQFDQSGSNVIFDTPSMNLVTGREFLPDEKAALRLGIFKHPLGPPGDPGLVQAAEVYDSILSERPYPVKAMVLFGSDPLLGHGDPLRGKAALERLEFYVHVDIFANPSAQFADFLLPASTCWEREALMPSFDIAEDTITWVQLRPAVIEPLYESRSDTEIIFELAKRLELRDQFFAGDIDTALNFQLAPSGLSVQQLRENPRGLRVKTQTRYRKYREVDPGTGRARGFDTPTRKIELYSTTFAKAGYPALPDFKTDQPRDDQFPLTLTFFRDIHFCDEQHRNIPRLRRPVPEPCLEINPVTAKGEAIEEGEWIVLETATAKVKLKAKFNRALHPSVVATVYGWWQSCERLNLNGYDPFCAKGANTNLLISNRHFDPISASVAHRNQRCRVTKV